MTVTLDPRNLSRGQQEKLQRAAAFDELAEELVAEEYGLEGLGRDAEWFDLRHPTSGAKHEVKSTSTEIGEKFPAEGRFRIWQSQTRSLVASDARATAWYVFVLLDERDGIIRIQRRRPSTVAAIVRERGGWNKSGHESQGPQMKIPVDEVIER